MAAWNSLLRSKKLIKPNFKIRYVLCAIVLTSLFILMKASWTRHREIEDNPIVPAYPFEKDQTSVNSLLTEKEFRKVFEPPLLGAEKTCSNGTKILVALTSAATNRDRRQAIRETWSQFVRESNQTFLFFVAQPSDANLRLQIELESQKYQDIVLLPIRDTYYLLTFKILAVLNWAHKNCPNLAFVMKCDDDFYVDWPNLFRHMAGKDSNDLFYGRPNYWTQVDRNRASRWYMPESDYAAANYPIFLSGSPFFVSYSLLPKLLKAAGRVKWLYIDDMFITGILRLQIPEARLEIIPKLYHFYLPQDERCLPLPALAIHQVDPFQMRRFFENRLSSSTNWLLCSIYKCLP